MHSTSLAAGDRDLRTWTTMEMLVCRQRPEPWPTVLADELEQHQATSFQCSSGYPYRH